MRFASFDDVDVAGRRVLVREDLNVPLRDGDVADATRIEAALPTLRDLAERGARVIVTSHLGRPEGKPDPAFSLRPVAARLERLLGRRVAFAEDCVGPPAQAVVDALRDGEVALLENVRFHAEEEADDEGFARRLASLADLYVNDAFAASHRAHASVVGVAAFLPTYAGRLLAAELDALHRALDAPVRPLLAIVGGAKVSTKAGVLRYLLPKVDAMLIGGAMANTFFKAAGVPVGASLVEDEALDEARDVAAEAGDRLVLPVDVVCARRPEAGEETRTFSLEGSSGIEDGWMALDVGRETRRAFADRVAAAGTVVWNGPVGVAEVSDFAEGTRSLGEAIAASSAFSLLGGGDTAAAVAALGLEGRFSHVSTGGGATLEYLEGKQLPGVAVLRSVP